MRHKLTEFYRYNVKEYEKIWRECIFVFDTNVLLGLYRYSHDTSEELLNIIKKLQDRIWIPYQIALEYQSNRLGVISEQEKAYEKVSKILEEGCKKVIKNLEQFPRHPFIDIKYIKYIKNKVQKYTKKIQKELTFKKGKHPNWAEKDAIRSSLDKLFDNKVGDIYSEKDLNNFYKQGEQRYKEKIPPGYSDNKKVNKNKKFSDLIIWLDIIGKAKIEKKPIILITSDMKEDWWEKINEKTIGPRYELIREIKRKAKVSFYMYQADRFMEYAKKYLKYDVKKEAISEVKKFRDLAEQQRNFRYFSNELDKELAKINLPKRLENIYGYELPKITLPELPEYIKMPTPPVFPSFKTPELVSFSKLQENLKKLQESLKVMGMDGENKKDK